MGTASAMGKNWVTRAASGSRMAPAVGLTHSHHSLTHSLTHSLKPPGFLTLAPMK
jgi:hypothetical protein